MNRKKKISLCIVIVLAIVGMLGLILLRIYNPESENSFFIPCFFYKIMGIKCPGCGMTRSLHNLVNGDIKKAIWYNVMSIPAIVLLIYNYTLKRRHYQVVARLFFFKNRQKKYSEPHIRRDVNNLFTFKIHNQTIIS